MPSRKPKKVSSWVGLVIILLIVLGFSLGWMYWASAPVDTGNEDPQRFVVKKGAVIDQIGKDLKAAGLIRSPAAFKISVVRQGIANDIQAGSFTLSPDMTVSEIAQQLTQGRTDFWVTVLEGWRREEIAQHLETAFTEAGVNFDADTFLQLTTGKEGYLFPDTYLFPLDADESIVASVMATTFEQKLTPQMRADITVSGRTLDDVITMASLIEREARSDASRAIVSGILWKRLDNDWPLQVDATLQYATGFDNPQQTWWDPPTAADKAADSPYNTYKNLGLPPGPIAAPSLGSIEAAIYPKASDYWYYLTDNDGVMRYAATLEGHNANIDQYLR